MAEDDDGRACISAPRANPDVFAKSFTGDPLDGIDGADCAGSGGDYRCDGATTIHVA